MINTSSIPAVAITLWILAASSAATWALILVKAVQQFKIVRGNRAYMRQFWNAANLQAAADLKSNESPVARLAAAGFDVLRPASGPGDVQDLEHSWDRHELLERNLRQRIHKERRALESGLALLATVGSTAPFVGLFGTVWGIMNAMRRIGAVGNVSIDVVAGPIGEALVATAIGIGVAVPAVLAYNYFLRRLKAITASLDDFAHDFVNLAQRATYRLEGTARGGSVRRELRIEPHHESRVREESRSRELGLVQSAAAGGANS